MPQLGRYPTPNNADIPPPEQRWSFKAPPAVLRALCWLKHRNSYHVLYIVLALVDVAGAMCAALGAAAYRDPVDNSLCKADTTSRALKSLQPTKNGDHRHLLVYSDDDDCWVKLHCLCLGDTVRVGTRVAQPSPH
jgi:hypothetical protein